MPSPKLVADGLEAVTKKAGKGGKSKAPHSDKGKSKNKDRPKDKAAKTETTTATETPPAEAPDIADSRSRAARGMDALKGKLTARNLAKTGGLAAVAIGGHVLLGGGRMDPLDGTERAAQKTSSGASGGSGIVSYDTDVVGAFAQALRRQADSLRTEMKAAVAAVDAERDKLATDGLGHRTRDGKASPIAADTDAALVKYVEHATKLANAIAGQLEGDAARLTKIMQMMTEIERENAESVAKTDTGLLV